MNETLVQSTDTALVVQDPADYLPAILPKRQAAREEIVRLIDETLAKLRQELLAEAGLKGFHDTVGFNTWKQANMHAHTYHAMDEAA